jgi:hypothetical protein
VVITLSVIAGGWLLVAGWCWLVLLDEGLRPVLLVVLLVLSRDAARDATDGSRWLEDDVDDS